MIKKYLICWFQKGFNVYLDNFEIRKTDVNCVWVVTFFWVLHARPILTILTISIMSTLPAIGTTTVRLILMGWPQISVDKAEPVKKNRLYITFYTAFKRKDRFFLGINILKWINDAFVRTLLAWFIIYLFRWISLTKLSSRLNKL